MPSALPAPLAEDVLRRYADVLRVGNLEVNGEVIKWHTETSSDKQLENFCTALYGRLRQLPELDPASDDTLRQAAYWVCKAVSINYALIEVLYLVKRKVGVMCSIETRDDVGGLVSYSIEAKTTASMRIRLNWRGKNNIVHHDPQTAVKTVKGTLSCVETEFALPPSRWFVPSYHLEMKLRQSTASKFFSVVACKSKGILPAETVHIQDPLRLDYPAEPPQAQVPVSQPPADCRSVPTCLPMFVAGSEGNKTPLNGG